MAGSETGRKILFRGVPLGVYCTHLAALVSLGSGSETGKTKLFRVKLDGVAIVDSETHLAALVRWGLGSDCEGM